MSGAGTGDGGAVPLAHDFATLQPQRGCHPHPHVHYGRGLDTGAGAAADDASADDAAAAAAASAGLFRTDTSSSSSPVMRRRTNRAGTFRTVEDFNDFEVRPGWHPGAEPGLDPNKPDGGHASMPALNVPCDITVLDFSPHQFSVHRLENSTLPQFLKHPLQPWVKCRWVNVNGLSWDVIKVLGRHKNLHKLALEDLMNTKSRTKAEWCVTSPSPSPPKPNPTQPNPPPPKLPPLPSVQAGNERALILPPRFSTHAFIVLTLQKLVRLYDADSQDSDSGRDDASQSSRHSPLGTASVARRLGRLWKGRAQAGFTGKLEDGSNLGARAHTRAHTRAPSGLSERSSASNGFDRLRTIQRYHVAPNDARAQFMERHSALNKRDLAVACEQVALFITNDNTIISFFELSAADIELPIIKRLQTSDSIVREYVLALFPSPAAFGVTVLEPALSRHRSDTRSQVL